MGYKWTQSIATHDRVFKSKVITMVIQELPMALKLAPTQTLVIDYAGTPEEYRMVDGALRLGSAPRPTWPGPLGEADIKFTRYGEIYRDLLVDSVDGPGTAYPLRSSTRSWPSATSRGARCGVRTWQGPRRASASAASPRGGPARAAPQEKTKTGKEASKPAGQAYFTFEYVNIPLPLLCSCGSSTTCCGTSFCSALGHRRKVLSC